MSSRPARRRSRGFVSRDQEATRRFYELAGGDPVAFFRFANPKTKEAARRRTRSRRWLAGGHTPNNQVRDGDHG